MRSTPALTDAGSFVVSDMIGRNGHMLWPESRPLVDAYWSELPQAFRWNCQLARHEERFEDWDCSREGFEGIRAQDILPLLRSRFGFEFFFGFGNLVDPFIGRSFGPHFDPALDRDRRLVDRIHARDEAELRAGTIRPAHMLAVLRRASRHGDGPSTRSWPPRIASGRRPARCWRRIRGARRCPACHAISRIDPVGPLEPTQAGTFHTRDFALVHCRRCDCVRLEPAPTDADLRAMYADAVQFSDDTYSSAGADRGDAALLRPVPRPARHDARRWRRQPRGRRRPRLGFARDQGAQSRRPDRGAGRDRGMRRRVPVGR